MTRPVTGTSVQSADEKRSMMEVLGPGLVTGAADDDPSGIGTYSQVGAQFGYSLAWSMILALPLLVSIQAICARIGATTGRGIAHNLRRHYHPALLRTMVLLLLVANVINLGADLGAMGAVLALLIPGPEHLFVLLFGVASVLAEVLVSYERYARILKWTTLSLFSYIAVVLVADVDWRAALHGLTVPTFALDRDHTMALVAIFGTTISPYLFFWQAGQEVEERHRRHTKPLCITPREAGPELRRIRNDTLTGMGFSNITALSIVLATAATLHANGMTGVQSAEQAASALRPIAGEFAFALFALGIIGTGLLAVPVLAGSAAYAVSETFRWTEGLDRRPREAKAFYGAIALATLGGVALNFIHIDPMRALYWSAVVNGLLAPPLMVVTMMIARNPRIMGRLVIPRRLAIGGWLSTAVMWAVALLFLFG
ncbi:NRAMP family divalent metal transporter [Novosphingobium taihuense]|uniref:NRAMP (Natural resistance-associated macrophage protein)-like metal ion transporter n=1 Tax=Novosphingobium taihuense TaxID=260085 RepID=A0A7W7A9N4_9SPHN|nr:divalent metal cation transporter [Novosphingobium taihuense]MBB4612896.1 NRAMP (natural resistance-associated macrophage protein)-like metal ion transporter [Novosphingobium taihuense]TWH81915.1 NRAMP (natural resistance-associated macrophage protein)-like metal ion transporter [Novosphingobium taihuense]